MCRGAYNERANKNSVPYTYHQAPRRGVLSSSGHPGWALAAPDGNTADRVGCRSRLFGPKNSVTGLRHTGLVAGDYELLAL